MKTLKIHDPAMCCSSGVCGPNVNEKLVHLSAFLKGLNKNAYTVERFNLSQQPEAYVKNQTVADILKEKGTDALPLIFVDDKFVKRAVISPWMCPQGNQTEWLSDLMRDKETKGVKV